MQDPIQIARAVGDFYAALDRELDRFATVRLKAVRQLRRAGWSYDRIAEATGLSKGRVQQLVSDVRQPGGRGLAGQGPTARPHEPLLPD
ncbi:helix-turn-helix domain-containing protein [Terrabacter sp. Soil811]|uniref:helix-turn-helix domain-containing protein n=1 Tax=Terrabacter sp. Soil811 TaxID=1736419 RepID=UPI0012E3546A|nr:helix-turn-helix domain-containing protein [Terrabacter sp. Soil811]